MVRKRLFLLAVPMLLGLKVDAQVLPGTNPLTWEGDLAARMLDGMDRVLDRETAATPRERDGARKLTVSNVEAKRERFRKIVGVVDARVPVEMILQATVERPALVAEAAAYRVYAVRWKVLDGVDAEGLLFEPKGAPVAQVVALPDADQSPEAAPFARRLAENQCRVLVPVLIDRQDTWSGNAKIKFTNQPHREWIYRMAYEMGRHPVGYEVEKVMAAVDWFAHNKPGLPIGVAGYGEGGLVAFYSAALDARVRAALVSGYFAPREALWEEPIYRNVWGLLREFGDAEIAGLIAPRSLVVEASRHPEVSGPPPVRERRRGAAPGKITTPDIGAVRGEFARAQAVRAALGGSMALVESREPGSEKALSEFLAQLGVGALKPAGVVPLFKPGLEPAEARMHRQVEQLVNYTQNLVRQSEETRHTFWAKADASSVERWQKTTPDYRRYLWEEIIGKLPNPSEPMTASSRRIYDTPAYTGYEIMLPVWPDVFAYGTLLVPKDVKPGEKRPVVVCQHGLDGRPEDVIAPANEANGRIYAKFGDALARRGFIVYAPQNPYIFNRFRQTQRRAHPLKLSVYSFILGQHQRTLDWLATLPFVDSQRMAFYGLSYGGKTAVRVPPLLNRYCLSICSGDFNEWIVKIADVEHPFSYMYYHEYEIMEFDLGNTFNYAEMASLMAPRPFMVERGHSDGVGIDEYVSWEYAKVRRFYAQLGIADRTEIEYFNGPHEIHGVGTYKFLHKWLRWPER
jgi:dienelactone hydrolase